MSSFNKSPVGDAWAHYLFGQWAIGEPYPAEKIRAWDGTMPVSALNVVSSRWGSGVRQEDRVSVEGVAIPSLFFARLPTILMGVCILICLWVFARLFLNRTIAFLALLLGAFEPNLLGHSRFITTDIPGAFGFAIGMLSLVAWILRPSPTGAICSAALVALAQLTKTSNLLLYPIGWGMILLAGACWAGADDTWRSAAVRTVRRAVVWTILSGLFLLPVLHFAYSGFTQAHKERIAQSQLGQPLGPSGKLSTLLPPIYRATLEIGYAHNRGGHPAYLLGEHSTRGWWYYFPVAIVVKTPIPLLVLSLIGIAWSVRKRIAALLLPAFAAIAYLAFFCLAVNVNIGVRHILSVYPVLVLLAAYGSYCLYEGLKSLPTTKPRIVRAAVVVFAFFLPAWSLFEAWRIYPHYESYFNQSVGKPCDGWRVLGDSNVEWGQDAWIVSAWARQQKRAVHINPLSPTRGLIAVRADLLAGLTPEMAKAFSWLSHDHKQIDCLTPGILIYHIPE